MIDCLIDELKTLIAETLGRELTEDEVRAYCTECHEHNGKCRLKG